jgi:pyruvate/2-oxoglutarate/acetoin dehydrogenase E1 component/TPP-dependent pyruvate/acetoin dehydrogenase alpha subunit
MIQVSISPQEVLADYRLAQISRQASLMGRKEVFAGKAKFGIFGDGKELAQIALAKVFRPGDWRSGYYRDQTIMLATEELTVRQYFAQLYAHTSLESDPASAGRMMNGHFATRSLDEQGNWKNLMTIKNSSVDVSPTASQMPRLVGLAYASKLYRQNLGLSHLKQFSDQGNEIAFGTIGNASSAEGLFFESINAAGVLQIPMLVSVWDDGYGISVPNSYQITKNSISEMLSGLQRKNDSENGFEIFVVKGWDYLALIDTYRRAEQFCRTHHIPVLVHVVEMTQPQGHSTSGSHERYKSKDRLKWEEEFDCIHRLGLFIIENGFASQQELELIQKEAAEYVKTERAAAWNEFSASMKADREQAIRLINEALGQNPIAEQLSKELNAEHRHTAIALKKAIRASRNQAEKREKLQGFLNQLNQQNRERFNSHLHSQSAENALLVAQVQPEYENDSPWVDGFEIMRAYFDKVFESRPEVFAIGEDVGKIGDVNQGLRGMQEKYGELRVTDTGIREATILGQAIGAALRGLRPIAEIQYLDYFNYAQQIVSDDLATLQYRSKGGQKAPVIIRTRGHRLEGIWHSGSPMGTIIHALRGVYVCVPRNMVQAAGFYQTLLLSDEPGLVVECLNGYRLKEKMPSNIGQYTVPLGVPEVLRQGKDITLVTYGSMCRVVMEAALELEYYGIDLEVVDVQTLLPFDLNGVILESLKKTNRIIFADEDVSGATTAYMMQKVVDRDGGYRYLDSAPVCISAHDHRPPYGSDGDYFSKPNPDDIFDAALAMMSEAKPHIFG